ncbi:MAG: DUF4465 domain-containing protein [Thermodesulfobacteriota bacterium]|nr:DUF4465 domain-containing protein [Thermodesulfobacteriota bacterium]
MKRLLFLFLLSLVLIAASPAQAALATFDNLTPTIAYSGGGYYENGPNMTNVGSSTGSYGETINHNIFTSGGATFKNNHVPTWGSWDGWSYSNTVDQTTAGLTNQYSAYNSPSGGGHNSANYGVFFETFGDVAPTIDFGGPVTLSDTYITNTTYAYLAVVNGDDGNAPPFVKGPFAADDWFKVTVSGFDAGGNTINSMDIFLADYTDPDSNNWYALSTWTQFDLSSLGTVYGLGFDLSSTDEGDWGMNTPAYFAMDDLEYNPVPIPGAVLLLGSGLLGLFGIRKKRVS